MADPEGLDEDLFADLCVAPAHLLRLDANFSFRYENDDIPTKPSKPPAHQTNTSPNAPQTTAAPETKSEAPASINAPLSGVVNSPKIEDDDTQMNGDSWGDNRMIDTAHGTDGDDSYGPIGIKEDG